MAVNRFIVGAKQVSYLLRPLVGGIKGEAR